MSTRSSARNLFPPLDNPKLTIQRRPRVDPTFLNDFEMATNGNGDDVPPPRGGDLPVLDLRTMEELCQPTLNGRGGPIAPIAIQATNFRLKNDMIQQVQNSCQFHGLSNDDANKHLDKFLHVTQSIKVNRDTDNALRLCVFPHSLTHRATAWFDRLPRNSITTFEKIAKMFLEKYFPPSLVTKLRNETTNFRQCLDESLFKAWEPTVGKTHNVYAAGAYNQGGNYYQPQGNRNLLSYRLENYLGPPGFNQNQNRSNPNQNYQNKNQGNNHGSVQGNNHERNQFFQGASHGQNPPPAYQAPTYQAPGYQALVHQAPIPQPQVVTTTDNTITNLKEDLKGITTQSGIAYQGPTIHTTSSPPKVVERETESLTLIGRALIDVYEGELTLRVGKEAVACNLDQTSRYSSNYDAMSVNRIDLIDVACEEYSQEVLIFSVSGNPTLSMEPIVSVSSPTFTPFGDSDFLLEETDAFLVIDDESISPKINDCYYDSEGDMLLLEEFLNDDPSSPPLPPQELKVVEPNNEKASIDEPPMVEFKDLPPHLEYAFLEGDDKLPVIIAKDLKDEGKTALKKVLKSHKQALAWQLSDIKGINPKFCTHKILMEDDFKPVDQHQRRVNPKIYEVIKKEVLKLFDAVLIYPISDSPWTLKIKKRPHSRVLMERLPIVACLLAYEMHRTLKIKKRPHSRVLMERLPIVACLLAYEMHRKRDESVKPEQHEAIPGRFPNEA
nr:reverse transcriptase domain-containing protein [Tanacetum cinerariifolium]